MNKEAKERKGTIMTKHEKVTMQTKFIRFLSTALAIQKGIAPEMKRLSPHHSNELSRLAKELEAFIDSLIH